MSRRLPIDALDNRLALTLAEAAAAIGVSDRHLRDQADLPRVRLGTRVVIPVRELVEWLGRKAQAEQGRADAIVAELMSASRPRRAK